MPRSTTRRGPVPPAGTCLAAAVLLTGAALFGAGPVAADGGPSVPPGTEASAVPPVQVDGRDPDLKMPDGGTLAAPKVLDLVQVVEDKGGEERREDTNVQVKLALQAEVLFGRDSAVLGGEATARIAGIAAEIRRQGSQRVRIFGFTDNLGTSAHGDVLSKQRAAAVHGVLSKQLPGLNYEIRGYGEQYPIADNATEEGRKKNRRVEVSFPRTDGGSAS
ncbi:OmpA family protein [Streptomyces sp. LP05-1]|uniref:OmpA family protein n=2 Tax=Streptomyces pyxinae TaxID=2970734 RepID=A0ABT2CAS5_9ACTN|nr:OmpA family protein [Streptomyces sp. LP05-1]MCS0634513.1 OmpA family protein [Streptomyces sp. LP05-1]